ncbi:hypothetical protein [Vitreimonas flagellata]|uniref:hypothetical protein n=1 Tax=Vitreimonas flagellata TaxID=2560861 RepID=UPI00142FBB1C|nr:hypothetical protein [Vitreimonas flagellata]
MAPPNFKSQVRAQRRRRALNDFRRRVWIGRWFLLKTAAAVTLAYVVSKWIAG